MRGGGGGVVPWPGPCAPRRSPSRSSGAGKTRERSKVHQKGSSGGIGSGSGGGSRLGGPWLGHSSYLLGVIFGEGTALLELLAERASSPHGLQATDRRRRGEEVRR